MLFNNVFKTLCVVFPVLAVAFYVFFNSMRIEEDIVTTLVQVDSVEIILIQTFPVRVQIIVHGQKMEDVEVAVKQEQKEKEVIVTMTQTHSRRIQPRLGLFKKQIFLEGGFVQGKYSLRVNNYSTTFEVM